MGTRLRRFRAVPDLATLSCALEGSDCHGSVRCRLADGSPVRVSPRQVLQEQVRRLAEHGLVGRVERSLSSSPSTRASRTPGPADTATSSRVNQYNVDYSILGVARAETLLGAITRGMESAGLYVESVKGECNLGQHEIAFRYADALTTCDNHVVYKNGAKENRGGPRQEPHVHAEVRDREGNSCHIHISLRSTNGEAVLAGNGPTASRR